MKKYTLIARSLLLLLVTLAACGSTEPQASAPTSTLANTPAPPTAPAATAAATAAAIAATPSPSAALPIIAAGGPSVALRAVAAGFAAPVYATHAGDGSGRIFVVEKRGTIAILRNGQRAAQPFLDITDRVGSSASEQGLLSVAFHPRYSTNGLFFVYYTNKDGNVTIARFHGLADAADAGSELVLLTITKEAQNHNGGLVKFGPDGFLYAGTGDGGRGGDPWGNAQNPKVLLGKLLRLDVDGGTPYAIPADNPFYDGVAGRPEIWAIGLRNPWRFSFDRADGTLYIADVGQNAFEEINVSPATAAGLNYGWNAVEGFTCYQNTCDLEAFTAPVAQYSHDEGCSITGGYVYRGASFPQLAGHYLYGDYCSGTLWSLSRAGAGAWQQATLLKTGLQISSFGEDEAGEVYLTALDDGTLYQVVKA